MNNLQLKEKRFERWLVLLTEHLRKDTDLVVELEVLDNILGDHLLLRVVTPEGLIELHVLKKKKGANLILLSPSEQSIAYFSKTLGSFHKTIPRVANVKRKFMHRVERMTQHLQQTYHDRLSVFPNKALQELRKERTDAAGMVGVESLFRIKRHNENTLPLIVKEDKKETRAQRRYPTFYAAKIIIPTVQTIFYNVKSDSFPIEKKELDSEDDEAGTLDVIDAGLDLASASIPDILDTPNSVNGDSSFLDTPDCDFFDVPDCSCDCSF